MAHLKETLTYTPILAIIVMVAYAAALLTGVLGCSASDPTAAPMVIDENIPESLPSPGDS